MKQKAEKRSDCGKNRGDDVNIH